MHIIGPFLVGKLQNIGTHPSLDSQNTRSRHTQRIMIGHFNVLCSAVEHSRHITVDKLGDAWPTMGPTSMTMTGLVSDPRMTTAQSPESNRAISKDRNVIGRPCGRTSVS